MNQVQFLQWVAEHVMPMCAPGFGGQADPARHYVTAVVAPAQLSLGIDASAAEQFMRVHLFSAAPKQTVIDVLGPNQPTLGPISGIRGEFHKGTGGRPYFGFWWDHPSPEFMLQDQERVIVCAAMLAPLWIARGGAFNV